MCAYKLVSNRQNFTEIYLAEKLQKVLEGTTFEIHTVFRYSVRMWYAHSHELLQRL